MTQDQKIVLVTDAAARIVAGHISHGDIVYPVHLPAIVELALKLVDEVIKQTT